MIQPAGFLSYCRSDDHHGYIAQFGHELGHAIRMHIADEFPIFQDRDDIRWGQNWRSRIDGSLDATTFLIAMISPGFFKSTACRYELEPFLKRERKLRCDDLVLPVYLVDCPLMKTAGKPPVDKLVNTIASRQYTDWRDLRFESFTTPQVGRMLAKLASQVRDALDGTIHSQNSAGRRSRKGSSLCRPTH